MITNNQNQFRQEFIKIFQAFCGELETIKPNDYEVVSSSSAIDPSTGKAVKTSYLRRKQ